MKKMVMLSLLPLILFWSLLNWCNISRFPSSYELILIHRLYSDASIYRNRTGKIHHLYFFLFYLHVVSFLCHDFFAICTHPITTARHQRYSRRFYFGIIRQWWTISMLETLSFIFTSHTVKKRILLKVFAKLQATKKCYSLYCYCSIAMIETSIEEGSKISVSP